MTPGRPASAKRCALLSNFRLSANTGRSSSVRHADRGIESARLAQQAEPEIANSWQVIKLQHSKRFKAAAAVWPLRAQNWQYDLRVPFLNDGERDTVRIPILCEAVSL
jgi:hypothetical protein